MTIIVNGAQDPWATWTAIGTIAAAVVAAIAILLELLGRRADNRRRREDNEEYWDREAHKLVWTHDIASVVLKDGRQPGTFRFTNASEQPITRLEILSANNEKRTWSADDGLVAQALLPGQTASIAGYWTVAPGGSPPISQREVLNTHAELWWIDAQGVRNTTDGSPGLGVREVKRWPLIRKDFDGHTATTFTLGRYHVRLMKPYYTAPVERTRVWHVSRNRRVEVQWTRKAS